MTDDRFDTDRVIDGPLLALHDDLVVAARRRGAVATAPVVPLTSRRPDPRVTRVLAAAAAVVVVVAGILGYGLATDHSDASADVTVERHGDSVTVSLDRNVTVKEIYDALDDTGVDVKVVRQTTGPSRVNQFVGIIASNGKLGGDGQVAPTATFDKNSKVVLELGVASNGGMYGSPTDATAAGEPLQGLRLNNVEFGTVQKQLEAAAKEHGVTLRYQVSGGGSPSEPDPGLTVVGASGLSAKLIVVVLVKI